MKKRGKSVWSHSTTEIFKRVGIGEPNEFRWHLYKKAHLFEWGKMKISVIGCGNLGESFIEGLLKSKSVEASEITASDPDETKLKELEKLGVATDIDNKKAAKESDTIFLAVKPGLVGEVLDELELTEDKLLVSLAAGVSTGFLEDHTKARVIRVMPNICGSVSEMASAYVPGKNATEEDEKLVENILGQMGKTQKVDESLMDAVTGLSGSGPAYIFLLIEALKEVGEELGLSEGEALNLAAQTVRGSGELVMDSDKSLEELVDMVCSPKGTTIEGVKVLKDREVQDAFKEAVRAASKRSKELSR